VNPLVSSPRYSPFTAFSFGNVSASGLFVRDVANPEEDDRVASVDR